MLLLHMQCCNWHCMGRLWQKQLCILLPWKVLQWFVNNKRVQYTVINSFVRYKCNAQHGWMILAWARGSYQYKLCPAIGKRTIQHVRCIHHICMYPLPPGLPHNLNLSFLMSEQWHSKRKQLCMCQSILVTHQAPQTLHSHNTAWLHTDMVVLYGWLEHCQSYAVPAGMINAHDQCSICISNVCE